MWLKDKWWLVVVDVLQSILYKINLLEGRILFSETEYYLQTTPGLPLVIHSIFAPSVQHTVQFHFRS